MKKKLAKQIEGIAGKLPLIMRNTCEKHIVTGAQLIEDGINEVDGKPVLAEQEYIRNMPVQIAVNHKRAMKKLFKKHKAFGVQAYINAVNKYHLQQNSQPK